MNEIQQQQITCNQFEFRFIRSEYMGINHTRNTFIDHFAVFFVFVYAFSIQRPPQVN